MLLQEDRNAYDAYAPEDYWSQGVSNYPVGEGWVSVDIEDLGGKLNINSLAAGRNIDTISKERFYQFFTNLGETDPEGLTAALIDWIDEPDTAPYIDPVSGATGAEADYYLRLTPPVQIADRPMRSLDELTLVRGFTPELIRRIEPHVTVYGSSKINVNTASAEVLMAYSMGAGTLVIPRDAAEQIVEHRRSQPFKKDDDLRIFFDDIGLAALLRTDLTVSGGFFRIRSTAEVNDGVRRIEAIVSRTQSPAKNETKLLYQKVD
jgi:general secretion pathway protein K